MFRRTSLVLSSFLALSCAAEHASRERALPSDALPAPPSALAGLVRALEVLDALRETDTWVRLRALESDSLFDRRRNEPYVRVVLDLTVFAHDLEAARKAFDGLGRALSAEARARERISKATWSRIERAFGELDWVPERDVPAATFAGLVSFSDSIRIEVRPARPRATEPEVAADVTESLPLGEYVQRTAALPGSSVGPVRLERVPSPPWPGFLIQPDDPGASCERRQIGFFLHRLEAQSPLVRVTRVAVRPAYSSAGDERWTFEAVAGLAD